MQRTLAFAPAAFLAFCLLTIPAPSRAQCVIDPTQATPQFRAAAGTQHSGFDESCGGAPPVGAFFEQGVGFSHSQVLSDILAPGQILIENYSHNHAYGWPFGEWHFMDGGFYLPDLIITGGPATSLTTAIHVTYGGSWMHRDCQASSCPETVTGNWSASVHQLDGTQIGWTGVQGFDYVIGAPAEVAAASLVGVPVGSTFGLRFDARFFNVGVNPVTVQRHGGFIEFLASSVFDLPEGYTLDSASGNITSNTWTAVPEPGSGGLLALGIAALALRRRR